MGYEILEATDSSCNDVSGFLRPSICSGARGGE